VGPGTFDKVARSAFALTFGGIFGQILHYWSVAAECVRLAAQIVDPERKLKLIDMAAIWMRLAEQAEKNSQTDLAYDAPPLSPDGPSVQ